MKFFASSIFLTFLLSNSWAQLAFQEPIHLDKNRNGQTPYAADFDNDGKMDLLHYSNNGITVLYNNGAHNFAITRIELFSGFIEWPITLAVGDLNKDDKADFAFYGGSQQPPVSVFLSTGRNFTRTEVDISNPFAAIHQLDISDFNNDGNADIVASSGTASLYFLQGDGSGEFVAHQRDDFPTFNEFVVSDINHDGLNDVIGANSSGEVQLYIAGAGGTFTPTTLEAEGLALSGTLEVADFTGDDSPDVVISISNVTTGSFQSKMYANDGNGNFTTFEVLPQPCNFFETIDFDNDGHNDLVGLSPNTGRFLALRNSGDGTFATAEPFEKPYEDLGRISIADFDKDGDDEIIAGTGGQVIRVKEFVNEKFIDLEEQMFGRNPRKVVSADMNHDGVKDLVIGNAFSRTVQILYGNANGAYPTERTFEVPFELWDIAVADFNSDGNNDIAYACNEILFDSQVGLLLSTPTGDYVRKTVSDDVPYVTLQAVDFNLDGKTDLIMDNDLFVNDGTGQFTSRTMDLSGNYHRLTRDMDNDGFPDVLVSFSQNLQIGFNDGDGQFVGFDELSDPAFTIYYMTVGYINQDQLPDIVIGGSAGNATLRAPTKILINKGNRQFETTEHLIYFGNNASIADFNLDGKNDILTISAGKAYVHVQDENGQFDTAFEIVDDNFYFDYCDVDDLNNDGKTDFYTFNGNGGLNVVFNESLSAPTLQASGLSIESISEDEVTATLQKGNGTGRLLLLRQNMESDDVPKDNIFYDFSSSFPSGATIGNGNHVVLTGDVTSVYISELEEGVEYELVAFEYAANADKTKIDYNVTQAPSLRFITKKKQTIAFGDMSDVTFGLNPITVQVSASSGLAITLTVSSGQASINGVLATPAHPGPLMLKASQPGNDEYMPAPNKELTFCVFPPVPTISVNTDNPAHPVLTSSAATNNQWQEEGTDIPGATNQTLEPEEDGIYSVKVSYTGCARTSLPIPLIITEVLNEDTFSLSPNPVTNHLTITVPGTAGISSVTIMDIQGQVVSSSIIIQGNTADVDLAGVGTGIYIVQIGYAGGLFREKVMKVK